MSVSESEVTTVLQISEEIVVVSSGMGIVSPPSPVEQVTFGRSGNLVIGAGTGRFPVYRTMTLVGVVMAIGADPTGADVICDVNKNGTTVFTTQANRPRILAGAGATASAAVPDVTALTVGDLLTVDIDQVGSTVPGADLTVLVLYT